MILLKDLKYKNFLLIIFKQRNYFLYPAKF